MVGVSLAASLASATGEVLAASPTEETGSVQWDAPVPCPDAEAAAAAIRARLPAGVAVDVHARVTPTVDGWSADIEIEAGGLRATRTLSSPRCETLLDATSLLTATVVEAAIETSEVAVEQTPPPPEGEPTIAPPPIVDAAPPMQLEPTSAPRPESPPPRSAPPPRRIGAWLYVDARGHVGTGVAPGIDLAAGGAVGLQLAHAAVEVGGSAGLPRRFDIADGGADVQVRWWTLEARGCGRWAFGTADRWAVLPCAAVLGGGHHGSGDGPALARPGEARDVWLAAGLGPAATLLLGPQRRFGLHAAVEGLAMLRRPGLEVIPTGEVFRVSPLGVRATIGVRVRFSVTDVGRGRDEGP